MEYKITELYRQAYGTSGLSYKDIEFPEDGAAEPTYDVRTGLLGRNVRAPLQIGSLPLPNEPLIEVTIRNIIRSTIVAGGRRKGSVKEFISSDDAIIRIRGVIVNEVTDFYPVGQLLALRAATKKPRALPVINEVCRIFGINWMVIESIKFSDMEGVQNAQTYEIYALSDEDVELNIAQGLNPL